MTAANGCLLLVVPSLDRGGGERVMLQLSSAFRARGREVHLAALRGGGPLRHSLPPGIVLHELTAADRSRGKVALASAAFQRLAALMQALQPRAVLSTITGANLLTVLAQRHARVPARIVLREASSLANARTLLRRQATRWLYPKADAVIAVSKGVAEDLGSLGVPAARLHVISNPVDTHLLRRLARTGPRLPELAGAPYLVALGRLTPAKDYPVLLRAYAASGLRQSHRLAILGEGDQRTMLEGMVRSLGLADRVLLPGALENPFSVLAGASLLVLPSRWEGCPNVLLEAMALGVPVVSTDCRHGPRELLADGRHGHIVAVGDHVGLARAMEQMSAKPMRPGKAATAEHSLDRIAQRYLALLEAAP